MSHIETGQVQSAEIACQPSDNKHCTHHWIYESAYNPDASSFNPDTRGVCKKCGDITSSPNNLDSPNEYRRNPNNQQYKRPFMAKLAGLSLDAIHTDRIDLVEDRVIGQKI